MKNILIMCFGKDGAAPAFAFSMMEGFYKAGNNVYCIVSDAVQNKADWSFQNENNKNIHVYFLKTGNRKTFIVNFIKLLIIEKKKICSFLNCKIDISIQTAVHPWMNIINKWFFPKHKMAIIHDPIPHSKEKKIDVLIPKICYKMTPEVIVMTQKFIPIIIDKYKKNKENVYYMKHGLYNSYKYSSVSIPELPNYTEKTINFLFFGRIEYYKGVDILIQAYEKLSKKHNNITLTIAGSGDVNNFLPTIDKINNLILINRFIKDEEVGTLFSIKNCILVVPYRDATQSGVIPIAIDYEVPIIASNTGGLKEQLNDGKIGEFIISGDVSSLIKSMEKMIENEEYRNHQKQLCKEYRKELEWEHIAKKLIEEIDSRENLRKD